MLPNYAVNFLYVATVFGLIMAGIGTGRAIARRLRRGKADPHWISFPIYEDGRIIGYRVAWSARDPKRGQLLVGHYFAGDPPEGPSIGWCENAAERHAQRFNEQRRCPWEFDRG